MGGAFLRSVALPCARALLYAVVFTSRCFCCRLGGGGRAKAALTVGGGAGWRCLGALVGGGVWFWWRRRGRGCPSGGVVMPGVRLVGAPTTCVPREVGGVMGKALPLCLPFCVGPAPLVALVEVGGTWCVGVKRRGAGWVGHWIAERCRGGAVRVEPWYGGGPVCPCIRRLGSGVLVLVARAALRAATWALEERRPGGGLVPCFAP